MASATNKVSSVLRIVRGERDALVRTAHFKAASENVSFATIERKTMSTKTSFKRVALVAVAALGLGFLTSVSASATAPLTTVTQFLTGSTATAAQAVVGGQAQVTVTIDSATVTRITVSGVGSVSSSSKSGATGTAAFESTTSTYLTGSLSWTDSVSGLTTQGVQANIRPTDVVTLYSAVAGVTTVTATPLGTDGAPGTAVSTTVTWVSALTDRVDHSKANIDATVAGTARIDTDATAAALTVDATSSSTSIATISVMQYASTDTTTVSTLTATNLKAVVATITGAGSIASQAGGATLRGGVATVAAGTAVATNAGQVNFWVYPDGRSGVGTITITVGGTLISTKTVTFTGASTQIAEDVDSEVTPKIYVGIGETQTINFMPLDAAGNLAAAFTAASAKSATTSVATISLAGTTTQSAQITVTGVALGTSVITACKAVGTGGTCSDATIKKDFTVTVTEKDNTAAGSLVTMTFDKATYAPGEKMLLTVAATGATGTNIADGSRTLFSTAPSANAALSGTLPTEAVTLAGGKKTFTLFAPLVSGDVSVSAVDNTAALKAVTATATISGGSADAALDAANEATDAAYAAADAADNATQAAVDAGAAAAMAQESADAALAAVTDLGIKVTGLLDALSKSLANIYKIIKAIQAKQK